MATLGLTSPAVAGLVAHVTGGGPSGPPPATPVSATAAAYLAVAGAGMLVAPLLTRAGADARLRRVVLAVIGATYGALLLVSAMQGDAGLPSAVGGLALATGAVAVARRSMVDQAMSAAVLLGAQIALVNDGGDATHLIVVTAHLVAAAVWTGGVLHLAVFLGARPERAVLVVAARRLTRWAVGAGVALAGTGAVLLALHHVSVPALPGSTFGRLVLAKTGLLALAGGLGLAHRLGAAGPLAARRLRLVRVEAGTLAVALGAAVVLAGLPDPQPPVEVVRPGLAVAHLSDAPPVTLFTVATSTTTGAVQLVSAEPVRFVDRATGADRQLTAGETAPVVVRGGRVRVDVVSGTDAVSVDIAPRQPVAPLSADPATADVGGWTAYQLGRDLDGDVTPTAGPSSCTAAVRTRDTGAALAARLRADHVRRVYAVTDGSTRSTELLHGVAAGHVRTLRHPGPTDVLVATGADTARRSLERLAAASVQPRAVYLAPWLLDGRVLTTLATARVPPVLVAGTVDALSPAADRYRAVLARIAPGVAPSAAGLLGYLDGAGEARPSPALHLYAAAPIGFLPAALETGHDDHEPSGWFPHGSVVAAAATAPLPACSSAPSIPDPTGEL